MKRTAHKTTFVDVLEYLLDGPKFADDIGAHFWPDKIGYGPSRGGPSSVAVSASYLLGKMARRRLVEKVLDRRQSNYAMWYVTDAGHEYLRTLKGTADA